MDNKIIRKFINLDKFLIQARDGQSPLKFIHRSSRDITMQNWSGSKDFEEAFDLAYKGWTKGLQDLKEKIKKYRNSFIDLLPKQDFAQDLNFGLEGEAVDVGRALEGIPESMIKFEDSEKNLIKAGNKMQRIIIQNSTSCNILPEVIMNRGALIVELIEAMELHGFRTELILRSDFLDLPTRKISYRIEIIIKQFNESPDFSKLSFVIAHPSMLRRLIFSIEEQELMYIIDTFGFIAVSGYGIPTDSEKDEIGSNDIYFGRPTQNYDLATLVKIIREKVAIHFNIILIEE